MRAGDQVALLDGKGRSWLCELGKGQAKRVGDWPAVPPATPAITAYVALCKGSRFEGALEKMAELGVAEFVPLTTARTERKAPSPAKLARWQEISLSASALAGRLIPMRVLPVANLATLEETDLVFCHPSGELASSLFSPCPQTLKLLVGPEGGFTQDEVAKASAMLSLGPLNLRVETAAVCAVTLALAGGM